MRFPHHPFRRFVAWVSLIAPVGLVLSLAPACDSSGSGSSGGDGGTEPDVDLPSPEEFDGNFLIPEKRTGTSFSLTAGFDTHDFGTPEGPLETMSYDNHGVLGPTLVVNRGDQVSIEHTNELDVVTTLHNHGLRVPATMDGGTHGMIMPGESFVHNITIHNEAATYWYHPHPHGTTRFLMRNGLTGFLIVRDEQEAALELPRIYGVDDLPIALKDVRIEDGELDPAALGNVMTINGTTNAWREVPAQVVRLRLLNPSSERNYQLGFDGNMPFHVIAGDAGYLEEPYETTRLMITPSERYEILLDLTEHEPGDSITMHTFSSEIGTRGLVGGTNINGGAFDPFLAQNEELLTLEVVEPTEGAVTSIPSSLVSRTRLSESQAETTRTIQFTHDVHGIDGQPYDMNRIDQVVPNGAIEIWEIETPPESPVNHVFHIHAVSFYVLDRTGIPDDNVAPWASGRPEESGPKDSVLVNVGETVRIIMEFGPYADPDVPYMYHCHMLPHEDAGMMANFLVVDE